MRRFSWFVVLTWMLVACGTTPAATPTTPAAATSALTGSTGEAAATTVVPPTMAVATIAAPGSGVETAQALAAPEPPAAALAANAKVGEDVRVGQMRWKVLEAVNEGETLKSPNASIPDATTSDICARAVRAGKYDERAGEPCKHRAS